MDNSREDIAAIKKLAEAWRTGWLTGDVELLLSLYAGEPVLMPEGQPAVMDKATIRRLYASVFNEYVIQSESRLMDIEVCGDLGYFWSTYQLTATAKAGGASLQSTGKSLFIVKRQSDGEWRIARLMDNSSTSPA